MSDFENQELNEQNTETTAPELTVETNIPAPQEEPTVQTTAEGFNMPEPPQAPQPTAPNYPQQQYTAPQYTAPQYSAPQYTPPQFNAQQYQQPYGAPQQNFGKQLYNTPPAGYNQKSRLAAALLAFTFGMFGVHNFYLGNNSRATIQLIVSIAGILLSVVFVGIFAVLGMYVWAFIEGVQLLSSNPAYMYDGNGVITKD